MLDARGRRVVEGFEPCLEASLRDADGDGTGEIERARLRALGHDRVPHARERLRRRIDRLLLVPGDRRRQRHLFAERPQQRELQVVGKQLSNGAALPITINAREVSGALEPVLAEILSAVRRVIEDAKPEVTADLYYSGLTLTGGGSLLAPVQTAIRFVSVR